MEVTNAHFLLTPQRSAESARATTCAHCRDELDVLIEHFAHGGDSWRLGVVVAIAMGVALTFGCLTGAAIPILLRRAGADPATASTIFLTMVTDSMSFLTFLGLASALSGWLGVGTG